MKVWLITGAARGLGRAIAEQALARGDSVVATSRKPERTGTDRLLTLPLDVTDPDQPAAVVRKAVEHFGRIDVLVNNAGYGLLGAVEEADPDETDAVFRTNVFGLLAVTRAVLPTMRAQRSGCILNISSLGGFAQVPGWGIYGATKFAVEGLSEALRGEVEPLGIRVIIVEPGSFRTDFLAGDSLRTAARVIDDYAPTTGKTRNITSTRSGTQPNDPAKGAKAILTVADEPNPPVRLQLGADAVAVVEQKLRAVAADLDRWRDLSLSTEIDGPP